MFIGLDPEIIARFACIATITVGIVGIVIIIFLGICSGVVLGTAPPISSHDATIVAIVNAHDIIGDGAVVTFSPFVSPLVFKDRRVGVAGGSVL